MIQYPRYGRHIQILSHQSPDKTHETSGHHREYRIPALVAGV